jgi:hypothetical protein
MKITKRRATVSLTLTHDELVALTAALSVRSSGDLYTFGLFSPLDDCVAELDLNEKLADARRAAEADRLRQAKNMQRHGLLQ